MSKSKKNRGPGRPCTFTSAEIKEMQRLMKRFGISHTQRILAASGKNSDVAHRNESIFPKARKVSQPTLKRYADKAGITLHRGRPSVELLEGREKGSRKTFASQMVA